MEETLELKSWHHWWRGGGGLAEEVYLEEREHRAAGVQRRVLGEEVGVGGLLRCEGR